MSKNVRSAVKRVLRHNKWDKCDLSWVRTREVMAVNSLSGWCTYQTVRVLKDRLFYLMRSFRTMLGENYSSSHSCFPPSYGAGWKFEASTDRREAKRCNCLTTSTSFISLSSFISPISMSNALVNLFCAVLGEKPRRTGGHPTFPSML